MYSTNQLPGSTGNLYERRIGRVGLVQKQPIHNTITGQYDFHQLIPYAVVGGGLIFIYFC